MHLSNGQKSLIKNLIVYNIFLVFLRPVISYLLYETIYWELELMDGIGIVIISLYIFGASILIHKDVSKESSRIREEN